MHSLKNQVHSYLKLNNINNIAVLCGGDNSEREVSLRSGKAVFKSLEKNNLNPKLIDIKSLGKDSLQKLMDNSIDLAVIMLHGKWGENGVIQAVLDFMKIPYTGSDLLPSAIALNKHLTKKIWKMNDIPTLPDILVRRGEKLSAKIVHDWMDFHFISYPLAVKPNNEGSTIGVTKAHDIKEVLEAIDKSLEYDDDVLIEPWVIGSELTVAWLDGSSLEPLEIFIDSPNKEKFYDYDAKYKSNVTKYLRAKLSESKNKEIKNVVNKACSLIGIKDFARVDLFINRKEEIFLLEVNSIPGMTERSLVPKAAGFDNIDFDELVLMIVHSALKRYYNHTEIEKR